MLSGQGFIKFIFMEEKRLFLLDAFALIFRAYYALIKVPRLRRDGMNTSAVFGFVNTLEELIRKENPTHIAVCFDPQGPTFRSESYKEYKAERAPMPEDIRLSIPYIKDIVRAYNIPVLEVEGFEADDVIGTVAKRAEAKGYTTYMMTPDKDFGQLVSPNILQYKPSYRGQDFELRGEEEVCARYGLERTAQVIDLLALMGDKIDNIPGCPGVGEKTAVKLISEFGGIEGLLANTDKLKGALKKKIEDNAKQIRFSYFLATIRTDVPVEVTADELKRKSADRDRLFAIFDELEFKTLAERVERRMRESETGKRKKETGNGKRESGKREVRNVAAPSLFGDEDFEQESAVIPKRGDALEGVEWRFVSDGESLRWLGEGLESAARCGLYIVAEGENDMGAVWRGTAVATPGGKCGYIPVSYEEGCAMVLDLLARGDIEKVTADAKRDMVVASRHRNDSEAALRNYYDVSLAHYVVQPEMRHALEALAPEYLGFELPPHPGKSSTKRSGAKVWSLKDVPQENVAQWACALARTSLLLREPLARAVEKSGMESLLRDVELPLVPVLADMEITGVLIDTVSLRRAEADMEKRLESLASEIYSLAGMEFNISSPAMVGEVLFDRLGLDAKAKRTKTGQYSTSEDVLEKLLPKHPVVKMIMDYRAMKKLLTTYLSALPASINPETGRVHTNYNQTVTATGRISSSAPNLQNIPVRDEEGRDIRRAFIASPGHVFLSADYSQIELRLLADFSGDPIMTDAFRHGKDIHAITAAKIYHKEQGEVTANERRNAKTANFGIVYGISAFGLSTRLGIPRGEAKEIIDNYFLTFPTVKQYMADSVERAREQGYVETRMGRRRILADINSRNPVVRGYSERNAINAPLQGTAADIIKVAMIRIWAEMKERGLKSKMTMQVHDELNFDVAEDETGVMQELVLRQMEGAFEGAVPLTADSGVGMNWLEAH